MKPISIIITSIFLIFLYSGGENANVNAQNTVNLKLIKVTIDSLTVYEFSYNNANPLQDGGRNWNLQGKAPKDYLIQEKNVRRGNPNQNKFSARNLGFYY